MTTLELIARASVAMFVGFWLGVWRTSKGDFTWPPRLLVRAWRRVRPLPPPKKSATLDAVTGLYAKRYAARAEDWAKRTHPMFATIRQAEPSELATVDEAQKRRIEFLSTKIPDHGGFPRLVKRSVSDEESSSSNSRADDDSTPGYTPRPGGVSRSLAGASQISRPNHLKEPESEEK